ncbi:glucose-6-phosphate dehydrogenase [Bermanella marisrubri]|nr:glucose-6-phosphate dehydrogenase [Bermanella marisrubri]QIZ85778.1 glucose-6-phosphate dehydrogenase [Bermanella marisrubri]
MPDVTEPFELVLFGAKGDLAHRKLIPALYNLHVDGRLSEQGNIWAITRPNTEQSAYIEQVKDWVRKLGAEFDEKTWKAFSQRIKLVGVDLYKAAGYSKLAKKLNASGNPVVYYCAVHSRLYPVICEQLFAHNLITEHSAIVLEKPIGNDYESGMVINRRVAEFFEESQIYRIDHYLGKETVQNLLALRFANSIFEHQWNQRYIDHIQITISETVGVEQRAGFYEGTGALRDMLQNHLLQLLCMTAMEPPASMEAESVREEKVKVLKALKPIVGADISECVVRGQYGEGISEGEMVPKYKDEPGVDTHSTTETFVALKAQIDNWRWSGVPFYLRTGKRLAKRACEIVVQFKEVPHSIFEMQHKKTMANKLVFHLQPDEGVSLQLCEKRVGNHMQVRPMVLSLNQSDQDKNRVPEAYERLLADAINRNPTLFLREDELMTAWQWVDPILNHWQTSDQRPDTYTAGSWGPAASTLLLAKDGRLWEENS